MRVEVKLFSHLRLELGRSLTIDLPDGATVATVMEHPLYTQASETHAAGDNETAISLLREHLSMAPDHSAGWNDLGAIMYEQGDVEEAARLFSKAVLADPGNSTAFENLVDTYTNPEKYAEAALLATRWSEHAPESPAPWIALAKLNLMAGNTEVAREDLDRARAISPENEFVGEAISLLDAVPSSHGQGNRSAGSV